MLIGLSAIFFLLASGIPIYMVALLVKRRYAHGKLAARSDEIEVLPQLWRKDVMSEQLNQPFYRLIVHDTNKLLDGVVILICKPNIVVRKYL